MEWDFPGVCAFADLVNNPGLMAREI